MKNNAIIFGDSYSTFENYIPAGYAIHYFEKEMPYTDVTKVTQTWWHQVMAEAELNLVLNDSWSGSTIGYTGYDGKDCSQSSSFIYRLNKLTDSGFFETNTIHTAFVFGGTNDTWADAPLGTAKYDAFEKEDLYFVLPAVCYFFKTLRQRLPDANIYCLINTELKPQIAETMHEACRRFGIAAVTFDTIDIQCGHPTIRGMQDIKNAVIKAMKTGTT